ncbi:bifunctional RNase H/acid phosphatase [Nocardia farcinica]|uniref:Bifunctional RNase H/acid phosphatase n=1 Tax=Nocardia farcinica TaxID=37329 RepID=A0A449GJT6_NOCFR|nr:bifunctional RNase H/acid phosphatase [Nocardia farcinica]
MSPDHDQPAERREPLEADNPAADTTADLTVAPPAADATAAPTADSAVPVPSATEAEPGFDPDRPAPTVAEQAAPPDAPAAEQAVAPDAPAAAQSAPTSAEETEAGFPTIDAPFSEAEARGSAAAAADSPAADRAARATVAHTETRAPQADSLDADDEVETIVHVLRHGEVHNPNGILYGRLPGFGLSVTGRAQAGAVARALADHDIALVIASPLQRAQETAEPIAAQHGLLVRTDENLIEAGNTFEGLRVSVGDGALRKPRHWWKLRDPFTPSWGEPYLQIAHRMLAAVNKARVEAAGHEAVLVSHQLPVWTLRRFLQGQRLWHDPRTRQCSLASLTSLVYRGDTLVDIVYSEPAGGSDPTVHGA